MTWKFVCVGCVVASALLGCNNNTNTGGPSTTPSTAPSTPALPGLGDIKTPADKMLSDVEKAIADKKWDAADVGMAQLEKLKPSLPPEYAGKIDALKKKLDDARAAATPPTTKP